jgi:hypothetical protein
MLSKPRNRGPWRNGPVSPACHDQFAAAANLDGYWRTAWVAQRLAATAWTLRAGCDVMLDNRQAQQVQADDVIGQLRPKVGGDRFRNFDRCKLDGTLSKRLLSQRLNGYALGLFTVEKRPYLAVAFHALSKTGPAGALAGT